MKPLLLTALICSCAHADVIVDIYRTQNGNNPINPDVQPYIDIGLPNILEGSFTLPTSSFSPGMSIGFPAMDWHPFGLQWFQADIFGTITAEQSGTGAFKFSTVENGTLLIDGQTYDTAFNLTLSQGNHPYEIIYTPQVQQKTIPRLDGRPPDVMMQPNGRSGFELTDFDLPWKQDAVAVPEASSWWLWIVPLGVLLWRRK